MKKAKELNLTPYDSNAETQVKTPEPSTVKTDQEQSPKKFNPSVTDLSTSVEREKPDDRIKRSIISLPSVPHDPPDTQDAEPMEHENESTNDKPPLSTGNT